jgi:hypothetical protein
LDIGIRKKRKKREMQLQKRDAIIIDKIKMSIARTLKP